MMAGETWSSVRQGDVFSEIIVVDWSGVRVYPSGRNGFRAIRNSDEKEEMGIMRAAGPTVPLVV
jgi:hypothetical protein